MSTPRWRQRLAPESFVEARVATHLMWRVGSRLHAAVSTRGAARTPGWRAVAAASLAADLGVAAWLRRDRDFHLWPRWAVDAADLVLWCLAAGDDPDTTSDSVIPGVALAAEAGARLGLAGLVVPAANALVMGAVRRRRGHDPRLWQIGWQVMGVLGGIGLSVSAARRRQAVEEEHRRDLEARLQASELAGYHSLMSDADPVADRLQRASALIDLGGTGQGRRSGVGAWKAALGQATRRRAAFLADVLLTWQADHNLHPDLTSMVQLDFERQAGTVLLTLGQADQLRRALDGLALRGDVLVEVPDLAEARRADGRRDLRIAGRLVELGRPTEPLSALYDAVPTALAMSALWYLPPLSDTREGVALRWTLPSMALTTGAGVWSARRANRQGLAPRLPGVVASAVATAVYTHGSAASARHPHSPDGASWFPWMLALQGYELVLEHSAPELTDRQRKVARTVVPLVVALGWWRSPRPRSGRALVSEVVWPLGIGLWAGATARAIKVDADRRAADVASADAALVADAYEKGRERVLAYLSEELRLAEADLERQAGTIGERLADEAERRLEEVRSELAGIVGRSAFIARDGRPPTGRVLPTQARP